MIKIYDTMSRDCENFCPTEEGKLGSHVASVGQRYTTIVHVKCPFDGGFDAIVVIEYRGYEVA